MSEDKMRDIWAAADSAIETAYPNIYNLNNGMWGHQQIPNHGVLRGAIAKAIVDERDACAAIKDAEIASLHKRNQDLRDNALANEQATYAQIERLVKERAARDLMIKEFVEQFNETKSLLAASMHEPSDLREYEKEINRINDLIAKSEHHNSRALEKMLLEARIDELTPYDPEYTRKFQDYEAKLAELNKEQ